MKLFLIALCAVLANSQSLKLSIGGNTSSHIDQQGDEVGPFTTDYLSIDDMFSGGGGFQFSFQYRFTYEEDLNWHIGIRYENSEYDAKLSFWDLNPVGSTLILKSSSIIPYFGFSKELSTNNTFVFMSLGVVSTNYNFVQSYQNISVEAEFLKSAFGARLMGGLAFENLGNSGIGFEFEIGFQYGTTHFKKEFDTSMTTVYNNLFNIRGALSYSLNFYD